ncbi:hypothetical protein D3C78_1694370 [compost metagenome]
MAACSEDTYSAPPPAAERAMADARVRRKKRLVVMWRLARQGKKEWLESRGGAPARERSFSANDLRFSSLAKRVRLRTVLVISRRPP